MQTDEKVKSHFTNIDQIRNSKWNILREAQMASLNENCPRKERHQKCEWHEIITIMKERQQAIPKNDTEYIKPNVKQKH